MKNLIEIDEILGKYFANEPLAEGEKRTLMAYKDANRAEFDMLKSSSRSRGYYSAKNH